MQHLELSIPNNLNLLHDELVAAIPGFRRVSLENDGLEEATETCGRVESLGDSVRISFADDIPEADVIAVLQRHDATKKQTDVREQRLDRISELNAIPRSNWTTAQMRELIDLLAQEVTS